MNYKNKKRFRWLILISLATIGFLFTDTINNSSNAAGPAIDKNRFKRADPTEAYGTSKVCDSSFMLKAVQTMTSGTGEFLARLWALYGPPDSVNNEGFIYTFCEKETGLVFTAYCAGSGPAYGGKSEEAVSLKPVLQLFEELLNQTKPIDCQIEFDTDFGKYRSGVRNGIPFDEEIGE